MGDEAVRVVVRCRPPNQKEINEGRKPCVSVDTGLNQIRITAPPGAGGDMAAGETKSFTFDAVYDASSTQKAVYEETAFSLVESVLSGFNGTIFAYGQTGSGKTWSMQGAAEPKELRGIIPNSFEHIFEAIAAVNAGAGAQKKEFLVRCAFLEIYNEELRDLLSSDYERKLDLREDPEKGVFVPDLTYAVVDTAETMDKVMTEGNKHRHVGATAMNAVSSRSHSIFTVVIEASENRDGRECITRGKLNLVDLAGSERIAKTGAQGTRMKEGIKINLSLTALGNVISALVDGKTKHIPYRDSKLTRLLQDSLGGNTKTVMLAAINDADYNYEETLSTLRYANRAKNIKNKPTINEDPKDALLRQYKDEIERLKSMLMEHLSGAGVNVEALSALLGGGNAAAGMKPTATGNPAPLAPQPAIQPAATPLATIDMPAAPVADANETQAALAAALAEAERERREREELAAKLASLQHMLIGSNDGSGGGNTQTVASPRPLDASMLSDDKEASFAGVVATSEQQQQGDNPEVLAKIHEARKAQLKLRQQKKKEAKLREEQAALAEEKAGLEEEMKLLSTDLTEKERALKKLRNKYNAKVEAVKREFSEAQDEWRLERESLMTTLREQTKEMKLLEQVVLTFLSPSELGKLWERSEWDEDRDRWNMPRIKPKAGWKHRVSSVATAASSTNFYGGENDEDGGAYVDDESPHASNNNDGMYAYTDGGSPTVRNRVDRASTQGSLPQLAGGMQRDDGRQQRSSASSPPLPILLKADGVTLANFSSWSPTKSKPEWSQADSALPSLVKQPHRGSMDSTPTSRTTMASVPTSGAAAVAMRSPYMSANNGFDATEDYAADAFDVEESEETGGRSPHNQANGSSSGKFQRNRTYRTSNAGELDNGRAHPPAMMLGTDGISSGIGIDVIAAGSVASEGHGGGGGLLESEFFANAGFKDGFAMLPGVGSSALRMGLGGNAARVPATAAASGTEKPTDRPNSRGATRTRGRPTGDGATNRILAIANGGDGFSGGEVTAAFSTLPPAVTSGSGPGPGSGGLGPGSGSGRSSLPSLGNKMGGGGAVGKASGNNTSTLPQIGKPGAKATSTSNTKRSESLLPTL